MPFLKIPFSSCLWWCFWSVFWWCTTYVGGKSILDDPYWRSLIVHPKKTYFENEYNLHQKESFVLPSSLSPQEITTINKLVTQFLNVPSSQIWSPITDISPNQPFVFFHQRKAGGTSLRNTLNATAGQLSTFIAGFRGAPGDVYNVPFDKPHAVYAGHFQWGLLDLVARYNRSIREEFSCMTNFRHPIKRIESCIYYRFREFLRQQHINCIDELPLSTFAKLLTSIDEYGHSCLNEPFRILSGINDENIIDRLLQNNNNQTVNIRLSIMQLTLEHLQKCPPIVQEIYPSFDAMNRRYPLFAEHETFSDAIVANVFSRGCAPLHGIPLKLVEDISALEMLLYDAVFRKTAQHLSFLHNNDQNNINDADNSVKITINNKKTSKNVMDNSESEHVLHMMCRSQFAYNVREQRLVTQNDYFYVQKPKHGDKNNSTNSKNSSNNNSDKENDLPVLFIADNMLHVAHILDTMSTEDFFREVVELGSGASTGDLFLHAHPTYSDTAEVELLAVETRPRKCSVAHNICVFAHPAYLSLVTSPLSPIVVPSDNKVLLSVSRHTPNTTGAFQVSPRVVPKEVVCRDTNNAVFQKPFQKAVVVIKDPFFEYYLLIREMASRHTATIATNNSEIKKNDNNNNNIESLSVKEVFSRVSVQAQWQRLCVARHAFADNIDDVLYDTVYQRFVSRHVYNLLFSHNNNNESVHQFSLGQYCAQFPASRHTKTTHLTGVSLLMVSFEAILGGLDTAHRDTLLANAKYDETSNKLTLKNSSNDSNNNSSYNNDNNINVNINIINNINNNKKSHHARSRHSVKRHNNNYHNIFNVKINRHETFFRRLSTDNTTSSTTSSTTSPTSLLHRFFSFLLNQQSRYLEHTDQSNFRLGCIAPNLTLKPSRVARHMRLQQDMHLFFKQHREVFEVVSQDIHWVMAHWMKLFENETFLFSFPVTNRFKMWTSRGTQ